VEVHRRSAQNGIERSAGNALQAVALQPMFHLEMSDAGFDRGATFHPSPERSRRPASSSFVHMHRCSARVIVAAIAHVHMHLAGPLPDHALDLFHLRGQRVAIVGIGGKTFGADQPSAPAGNRHAHFVAELIRLARLALTTPRTKTCPWGPRLGDALDLGLMYAVGLVLVVPLLGMDAARRLQQPGQLLRWLCNLSFYR